MKHKLKLTTIFLSLIFFGCVDVNTVVSNIVDSNIVITKNKQAESCKESLHQVFINCYQEEDKVYYVSCSGRNLMYPNRSDFNEIPEVELNIGDTLRSGESRDSRFKYIVKKIEKGKITFDYEVGFYPTCGFGSPKTTIDTGTFTYNIVGKKEPVERMKIEGLEINAMAAQRHIQKGKIWILSKYQFFNTKNRDVCYDEIQKKFGYEFYKIPPCTPSKFHIEQIKEYNDYVFDYLKEKKGLDFENVYRMNQNFQTEVTICRNEKRRSMK